MIKIKSSLLLAAMTFVRMASSLAIGKSIAVFYGPAGVGILGYLLGITAVLSGLLAAPLGNGLIRAFAKENSNSNNAAGYRFWQESIRASIRIGFAITAAGIPLYFLFKEKIGGGLPWFLVAAAVLAAPFQAAATGFQSILTGKGLLVRLAYTGILASALSSAFAIFVIYYYSFHMGLAVTSASAVVVAGIFRVATKTNPVNLESINATSFSAAALRKEVWKYSKMALVTAALVTGAQMLIRVILENRSGWTGVGYWQAAQRLSDAHIALLGTVLSTQLLPAFTRAQNTDHLPLIKKSTLASISLAIPGAFVLYFYGQEVLSLLFAQTVQPAATVLSYQIIGDTFRMASWGASYYLIARERVATFCAIEALFSFIWVASTFLLTASYDWRAASIGYLVACVSSLCLSAIATRYHLSKE